MLLTVFSRFAGFDLDPEGKIIIEDEEAANQQDVDDAEGDDVNNNNAMDTKWGTESKREKFNKKWAAKADAYV